MLGAVPYGWGSGPEGGRDPATWGAVPYGGVVRPCGPGTGRGAILRHRGFALGGWGRPQGRYGVSAHTAPVYALGLAKSRAAPGCSPPWRLRALIAGRAAYPAGAPFLSKKWGKEDQGEGVSSPLDPSSLVGLALRAVPWPGDGPAAQARQVGCVRACRLGAQGLWV